MNGECEHSLVFNYAGNRSECGECGASLVKSQQGQWLNTDAFLDMYEACTAFIRVMQTNHSKYTSFEAAMKPIVSQIRNALAKTREEL